jgi:hypothetical protein
MRKVEDLDYIDLNAKVKVIAVFERVTTLDWIKIPDLCRGFYQEFGEYLTIQPVGEHTKLEIWLTCGPNVDIDEAESFVDNFVASRGINRSWSGITSQG